jgi:2-polyprenyl-3-methyl-5-hydroxy-6-metoxy-1,4-benzoquinol methylase
MRILIATFLLGIAALPAQVAGDAELDAFLAWEQKQPEHGSWDQREQLIRYHAAFDAQGLSAAEAAAKLTALEKRLWADESAFWSKIYSESTPGFNTKPNQLLATAIQGVRPGKALDVEMGQGRNAVFLAGKGWQVTGFDISEKALALAKEQAQKANVKIETVLANDEAFDFGKAQWDLIAILYPMEKRSYARAREALKPGGLVVVEGFHLTVKGPAVRYASNELLERFTGFKILFYEEAEGLADWGNRQHRLVKLIAQKPN